MIRSDQISISGSFGPNVVVTSGNKRKINIAGGTSGDVYHDVDGSSTQPFRAVLELVKQLPSDRQSKADFLVNKVIEEVKAQCDEKAGFIYVLIRDIGTVAPEIVQPLASAIVEQSHSDAVKSLAFDVLSSLNNHPSKA
jgi:hypothetical protein